jgi:UDP-galactopyranose mutase
LEFTGAPTRYYPIETARNTALNLRYQDELRDILGGHRVFLAGRLANYVYVDMDDCMRQAPDTADQIAETL